MTSQIKGIKIYASTAYDGPEIPLHANSKTPLKLATDDFEVYVIVRIRDYVNPDVHEDHHAEALTYFESERHKNDSFSIQFAIKFKEDVAGDKLLWGNDWDSPIRDILPWGFSAAFAGFKYAIDPGVDGDPYADKPWIYGAALSSVNLFNEVDDGVALDTIEGPIEEKDASARCKKYLDKTAREQFVFKAGKSYVFDFCSPYLDMSTTPKIKLPGFEFDVGKYAGMTKLRYVLKAGEELVFAVTFEAVKA